MLVCSPCHMETRFQYSSKPHVQPKGCQQGKDSATKGNNLLCSQSSYHLRQCSCLSTLYVHDSTLQTEQPFSLFPTMCSRLLQLLWHAAGCRPPHTPDVPKRFCSAEVKCVHLEALLC